MKLSHIVVWMALFFGSIGVANAAPDAASCDKDCLDAFIEMEQSQYEEC